MNGYEQMREALENAHSLICEGIETEVDDEIAHPFHLELACEVIQRALAAAPAVDCPPSNVAALRDALTPWVSLAEWLIENAGKEALGRGIAEIVPQLRRRIDASRAALSAPPRNCDVGTAEEQGRRYEHYCFTHRTMERCCQDCPIKDEPCCELAWAQMPYMAQEGCAK